MADNTVVRLRYFDLPMARGDAPRMALVLSGMKFEDIRVKSTQWPEEKLKAPLGFLPYIEIDDGVHTTRLSETMAVMTYICRKGQMLPVDNALELATIFQIAEYIQNQVFPIFLEIFTLKMSRDTIEAEEKERKGGELCEKMYQALDVLDKLCGATLDNAEINMADIFSAAIYRSFDRKLFDFDIGDRWMVQYPAFRRLALKVLGHPKIKAFYAADQQ